MKKGFPQRKPFFIIYRFCPLTNIFSFFYIHLRQSQLAINVFHLSQLTFCLFRLFANISQDTTINIQYVSVDGIRSM